MLAIIVNKAVLCLHRVKMANQLCLVINSRRGSTMHKLNIICGSALEGSFSIIFHTLTAECQVHNKVYLFCSDILNIYQNMFLKANAQR